jgi:hypothetical protein
MQQKVREGNSHNDFVAVMLSRTAKKRTWGISLRTLVPLGGGFGADVGGSGVPLTAAAFSAFAFADSALRGERLLELPPTHAFQAFE